MGDAANAGAGTPASAQQATPASPAPGDAATPADAPSSPAPPPRPIDPTSPSASLETLARALPPESIDELWIFPPRRIGPGQSTVVVASVMEAPAPDEDAPGERRRIFTARFTLVRGTKVPELRQELTEEGSAPAELVARVVDGVVRRLDDETEPPRHARIGGEAQAWAELLGTLRQDEG